ncbi:transcription factor GTE8-like [Phragmites australis]|uniref:transcription factor GTE8-like n=1 Tax=Phragmites australis TaxID=29695 RepID=UPI002D78DB26|nr:transcription factor GTE8-like [Phragmites australis]
MSMQACKKRRTAYISNGSEGSGTDLEVEGSKLSQKSKVTSISTSEHQPLCKNMSESMNVSKTRLCGKILRKLMDHKGCWLFDKPVDPVLFGIPDYFDVICNPMDLGTVKKKLTNKQYVSTSEFAADVRLTFSNAMKYNPPGNDVHTIAEQFNIIFESEWKSVERKWGDRNSAQEQQPMKAIKARAAMNSKSVIPSGLVSRSNSLAEKPLINAISSKVKINFSMRSSEKTSSKDMHFHAASSRERSLDVTIPCTKFSLLSHNFYLQENAKISRILSNANSFESSILSGNESLSCTSPLASSGQGEESYLQPEPLSPSKALRVAMLKGRFAGTIVKAQQNALLDHGKEIDPAKLKLEKERLEKRQQEEKARIEAQVRAAEAAAQLMLDEEMRMKREQERKAARLALHMMKKTVDIDNSDFLKDLENLCQKWQLNPPCKLIVDFVNGIELPPDLGSPLEALGLFMKKDLEEEVEHEMEDSI